MRSLRIIFLFVFIGSSVTTESSIKDQLDEKLRHTKIEIAKLYFQEEPLVPKKLYNVQWEKLWQEDRQKDRPFIMNAFGKILLFEGTRVRALSTDTSPSNQSSQEVTLDRSRGAIKFVRNITWKSVLYLLVCYETGWCSLYTGTDNLELTNRQTIRLRGRPMDACFFVRDNRLYLVVADNSGQYTVPSLIYHWRGTYMDAVAKVMTTAAVSVTTFKHKQSTIIVFAQSDGNVPAVGSVVYEFKETSPDRIQFLSTFHPASVYHYDHAGFSFVFLINERGPSNLFWWDGQELLDWQQVAEIEATSLVHVVKVNDETFFFVGHKSTLQLYKFENASDCTLLRTAKLSDGQIVIDLQAQVDKSKVTLMLVTAKDNIYSVESWKWQIEEVFSENSQEEPDALSKHLSQLVEILERRQPFVEKAEASWPSLLPVDEDLTISEPLTLPTVMLDSGTLGNIDVSAAEELVAPEELEQNLDALIREVDQLLEESKKLLPSADKINSLRGNIVVQGDAIIEKLRIDKMDVDFINDVDVRSNDTAGDNKVEEFSKPLRGENIVIHDLEVDSLCGIPAQYWRLRNHTEGVGINVEPGKIEFHNDTVRLLSNVSVSDLNVKSLNDTDVDRLLSELFIIGRNQTIKGNITYSNGLEVQNLTLRNLNGKPWENYMTTNTNQSFPNFFANTLKVEKLYADSINGVRVSEAARISRENVIKGEVKLASLHVTDEFILDSKLEIPESKPLQIYYDVILNGSLNVQVLDFDKRTKILLSDEEINLNNLPNTFWTKSTSQVIENDVTFENNLIVDQLDAKYLNGFSEEDFLYTSVTKIPDKFKNLYFANVDIDDMFFVEEGDDNFFDVAPESLTINGKLHAKDLRGEILFADSFNGLPVTDLLNSKAGLSFPENMEFPAIRAKHVNVEELSFRFLNGENSDAFLENPGTVRNDRKSDFVKTPEFRVENLIVERINGLDTKMLDSLKIVNLSDLKDLVIDGDLTVTGDFRVQMIGDQLPEMHLMNLADKSIVSTEEKIDELIVQNASFKFLHDRDANTLFDNLLSKSRDQFVPGRFSFYKITSGNVAAKFINGQDTSKLQWIDEPLFFNGNVTFQDLFVKDVITEKLNGYDVNELYESLVHVPVTNIKDLKVEGNVSWNVPSLTSTSLSFLFENAVSRSTDQIIARPIVFKNNVTMSTVSGDWKEIEAIQNIVNDAVIDDEEVVEIAGRKTFKEDLTVRVLTTDEMTVPVINDINVVEFNDSVVRKHRDETISGPITFLEPVAANEVLVNGSVHGVPLKGLVLATDQMPPNVSFKHLVVLNDVFLKNLDGVEFDEFVKERVTISQDHDIESDIRFNGIVEVTGKATVGRLNGIDPSDLVVRKTQEMQIISGSKTFEEDLVVTGDMDAKLINGMDVASEYSNCVQKDEDAKIVGDLIFESHVMVPENVSVSGLVNGVNLHTALDKLEEKTDESLGTFARNQTKIEESLVESHSISRTLRNAFFYLEAEETLKIHAPNIKKVDVVKYGDVTKLNMLGEESGPSCGLGSNCSCPVEYVAEFTKGDCKVWRTNGSTIVRNYHEPHGTFGINVITNAISSSRECTSSRSKEDEFTTISWMKYEWIETGNVLENVEEQSSKIRGYVRDTEVFTHENAAFVVLAIYYDYYENQTHLTNSLIYKIDLEKNILSLHQILPTDGAWDIEIFKRNNQELYLLVGCFGNSKVSYLYKLDAITSKFVMLRTFRGKTRNVKNLFQEEDRFILLDNYDTHAVNIFYYEPEFDNFFDYQSLFHDSRIDGIECFYADEFGQSDSFVIVATENDQFYIYEYMFAQKFQLKVHHRIHDLQTMTPFNYLGNNYIFTGTRTNSTILRIVQQGPR